MGYFSSDLPVDLTCPSSNPPLVFLGQSALQSPRTCFQHASKDKDHQEDLRQALGLYSNAYSKPWWRGEGAKLQREIFDHISFGGFWHGLLLQPCFPALPPTLHCLFLGKALCEVHAPASSSGAKTKIIKEIFVTRLAFVQKPI